MMYLIALMKVTKVIVNQLIFTRTITGKHFPPSPDQTKLSLMLELELYPWKPLMTLHRLLHHKSKSLSDGGIKESPSET